MRSLGLALALLLLAATAAAQDTIPAFPGAYDWGAGALQGCRNGLRIAKVTNGNASGAGSLDAALDLADDDTLTLVVFSQGVKISSAVETGAKCVYIAGQTAQGGGVEMEGRLLFRGANVEDVVVRYMRVSKADGQNILVVKGEDMMFDRITSRHGGYGFQVGGDTTSTAASGYGCVRNVTIQHSMTYEQYATTGGSSLGMFTGGQPATEPCADSISMVGNFIKDNSHRNPADQAKQWRILNNLIGNWNQGAVHTNGDYAVRVERNYFKIGPMTQSGSGKGYEIGVADTSSSVYCNLAEGGDGACTKQLYAAGNIGPHNLTDPALSNDSTWRGSRRQIAQYNFSDDTAHIAEKSTVPSTWTAGRYPWTIRSDIRTYADSLLSTVGAYQRRTCSTGWTPIRDAADSTEVAEWGDSTGIASYAALGTKVAGITVATPAAGTACTDADADDLPDDWETAVFGSTSATNAPDSVTVSGYFVAEHWVNGTDPDASLATLLGTAQRKYYKLPLTTDYRGRKVPEGWSFSSVVTGRIYRVGSDSVLWITYDNVAGQDTIDAATRADLCAAHANLDCDEIESIAVPGQPSAFAPYARPERLLAHALTRHLALAA